MFYYRHQRTQLYSVSLYIKGSIKDGDKSPVPPATAPLQPPSAATSLLPRGIAWDGSAVLDPPNLHPSPGKGTESRLGSGPGGLGAVTAGGPELDVQSGDAESLHLLGHVLSGQHSGVGGGLVTVSLHLHTTSHPADGLPAGQVGDVDEGVVEGSEDVRHSEDELAVPDLRAQAHLDLLLGLPLSLARCHGLARCLLKKVIKLLHL